MFLAIDIGNTNVDLGLFSAGALIAHDKVPTHPAAGSPGHPAQLQRFVEEHASLPAVQCALIASVVRGMGSLFVEHCRQQGLSAQQVDSGWDLGLRIDYDHPERVGIDRLLAAAAAFAAAQTAVVVADAGTAITVDAVDADGTFLGGAIAPGLRMMLAALCAGTSLLPAIEFSEHIALPGKNTADGMRAGVLYGAVGLIDGLCLRLCEMLPANTRSVLTGGDAHELFARTRQIGRCESALVLHGLHLAFRRGKLTV